MGRIQNTVAREAGPLAELFLPQAEQFGVELRRTGAALVGEATGELADARVCAYAIPKVGVVVSHRVLVRGDVPFRERCVRGLCVGALSHDSLALCPLACRGDVGREGGVAVFGLDDVERAYPLAAGSEQSAVTMTLLPEWFDGWGSRRRALAHGLIEGVGETCPEDLAAGLSRSLMSLTPLFGGRLADDVTLMRKVAGITRAVLDWHCERERAEAAAGTLAQARLVRAACHHVALHLDERLTLDSLAHDLLTSRSRLCAAFRSEMGEGLASYVRRARMERARQMLEAPSSVVAEVARAVGYANASSFVVAFEREYGEAPSRFRGPGRRATSDEAT